MPEQAEGLFQGHRVLAYIYDGQLEGVPPSSLAIYSDASDRDQVTLIADTTGARLLLLAGKLINEPVIQCGSFVMEVPY